MIILKTCLSPNVPKNPVINVCWRKRTEDRTFSVPGTALLDFTPRSSLKPRNKHSGELHIVVQMRKSSIGETEWFKPVLWAGMAKPRFEVQSSDTASDHSTILETLFRSKIPPEQGLGFRVLNPKQWLKARGVTFPKSEMFVVCGIGDFSKFCLQFSHFGEAKVKCHIKYV